jgi:putative membrane protein
MLLGASLALGACGGKDNAAGEANQAANEAGNAAASAGNAVGNAAESAGNAVQNTASGVVDALTFDTNIDANALGAMTPPQMLGVLGASNAAEIATSQAVVDKATNADVKAYARDMIKMHQQMQGQADQLATKLNIQPSAPDPAVEKVANANDMANQLGTMTGAELDRTYIDAQVRMHQRTLNQLQAMQNAQDTQLQTLVKGAIPKVQDHLQRAQRIQQQLGNS